MYIIDKETNVAYKTYKDQIKARKARSYVSSLNSEARSNEANIALGTNSEDTSFPSGKSKPSTVNRGVDWRSYAPVNSEYEWKWFPNEQKWVRVKNSAIRNAYIKMTKAQDNYNAKKYAYDHNQTGCEPDVYGMQRAQKRFHNIQDEVNRNNQEANAWLHENYNGASFYTTDTQTAPNMQKYLSNLSDDQLKQGIQYWKNQELTRHVKKLPLGRGKYKTDKYNTGDAVLIHHEKNYNDPNNLVHQFIHGATNAQSYNGHTLTNNSLYDDSNAEGLTLTQPQLSQLDDFGNQWNTHMSNQEQIRAEMNEATNSGNYDWLNSQYKLAKRQTDSAEKNWSNYMNSLHNKRLSQDLKRLFTSGKRQLHHIYYLDHTYYDRDQWRLAAFNAYLPIRHQQEIDASIMAQVQNNYKNHLTSIYRADKKTDQVIGVAELSPSESTDMNMATEPVDAGMPQTNYAQTNQIQLTDTGDLYDRPLVFNPLNDDSEGEQHPITRGNAYNVLRTWEMSSVQLVINGFTHWGHVLLQSLSKQPEQTGTNNALQISMTIQYVRLAHIQWGKKPSVGISKGRNNAQENTISVKPGQTIWGLAGGNAQKMRAIIKANPKVQRNPNYIIPKEKLVIPK